MISVPYHHSTHFFSLRWSLSDRNGSEVIDLVLFLAACLRFLAEGRIALASLRGTPIYVVMAMKRHRKEVKETCLNQTECPQMENVGSQTIQQDIWKEAPVLAYRECDLRQDNRCPGRDSNRVTPGYVSKALPLRNPVWCAWWRHWYTDGYWFTASVTYQNKILISSENGGPPSWRI
jgi:hypothetical protein